MHWPTAALIDIRGQGPTVARDNFFDENPLGATVE